MFFVYNKLLKPVCLNAKNHVAIKCDSNFGESYFPFFNFHSLHLSYDLYGIWLELHLAKYLLLVKRFSNFRNCAANTNLIYHGYNVPSIISFRIIEKLEASRVRTSQQVLLAYSFVLVQ